MATILRFPKTYEAEQFYRFILRYSDDKEFSGSTIEEAFRRQKDYFEPEISLSEYMERMRDRLLFTTGNFYSFSSINGLAKVLCKLGFLEVIGIDLVANKDD